MKLVVAVISPERLEPVQAVLKDAAVSVVTVSDVRDIDAVRPNAFYRGAELALPEPRLRLEMVVEDEAAVPSLVNAIRVAAAPSESGRRACGSVLVIPLEWERVVRSVVNR